LEDSGVDKAEFLYKQYKDISSYEKINEFSEISNMENLLYTKKCSYEHSHKSDTVEERCNLKILFIFNTTYFTHLNITAVDREGYSATLQLDYTTDDLIRSGDIIIIPGLGGSMTVAIPPYLLDIIAIFVAVFGTRYIIKKKYIGRKMRALYEEG
jgi:hypothetical protein